LTTLPSITGGDAVSGAGVGDGAGVVAGVGTGSGTGVGGREAVGFSVVSVVGEGAGAEESPQALNNVAVKTMAMRKHGFIGNYVL
jgi:hypothetical protein